MYAKICCRKTSLGNYFDDPTLPTGSLRYAYVYIAARRLYYCTQEAAVLSQRAAKCCLHTADLSTFATGTAQCCNRSYIIQLVGVSLFS